MLIDSHCHLDRLDLTPYDGSLDPVLSKAKDAGVEHILCVATDRQRYDAMLALVSAYPQVSASVGIHPLSDEIADFSAQWLEQEAGNPSIVAVGETGLDYHYDPQSADVQQRAFQLHLEVAAKVGKPAIVHTREAREDTLALIRRYADIDVGGVLHCFTEDWSMAEQLLDLNYHISFSGIITFRNAAPLREVVRRTPLEKILLETDAPYLTPAPYRGRSNEPCYVRQVAECVAEVKGISVEEVAEVTSANFRRLFSLAS